MAASNDNTLIPIEKELDRVVYETVKSLFPFYDGEDGNIKRDLSGAKKAKKAKKKTDSADSSSSTATLTRYPEYKCSIAMRLNAAVKKNPSFKADHPNYNSPRDIADAIVAALPPSLDMVEAPEVTGPGFITFKIAAPWLQSQLRKIAAAKAAFPPAGVQPKRVVVDFSSPNIAKEMHVGHLRSTIIGDTLSRVLEFVGFDVLRTNHVGDWGTQFGMLITHLRDTHPDFEENPPNISDLQGFYRAAKARFDDDEDFKSRSYAAVVSLQAREPDSIRAWEMICDVSRLEFQKIYDRLHVVTHEKGESFYHDKLAGVVETIKDTMESAGSLSIPEGASEDEAKEAKKAFVRDIEQIVSLDHSVISDDNGALCFWIVNPSEPKAPLKPLIVQKADGGYTYATTDFAALAYRKQVLGADWMLYVVDSGQSSHLECVFSGGKHLGIYDPADTRVEHVGFGVVVGEDGKKFKTRSGDVVRLVDLLDTAVAGAEKLVREKIAERAQKIQDAGGDAMDAELEANAMPEEEILAAASAIGHGCIKYADLKCNRLSNYMFSFERMLDVRGNTAVYLLYAYARMASILRVAGKTFAQTEGFDLDSYLASGDASDLVLAHVAEEKLAMTLLRFPDEIHGVLDDLLPSKICDLLYEISTAFSEFYHHCQVVRRDGVCDDVTRSRLWMVRASMGVMETCFDLLGVEYVGRL